MQMDNYKLVVMNTALANPLDGTVSYYLSTTGATGAYTRKARLAYDNLDDIDDCSGGRMEFLLAMQAGDYETACVLFDKHCTAVEISIHNFDNIWDGGPVIPPEVTHDIPNQIAALQSDKECDQSDEVEDSFYQDEEFGGQFQE